jgi:hypothetical protein
MMQIKRLKKVALFLWVSLVACQAGANLLINPSFESGITDWSTYGNGVYNVITSDYHAGTQCVELGGPTDLSLLYQRAAGAVGNIYTVSVWAKSNSGTASAALKLEFHQDGSTQISQTPVNFTATSTWTKYSVSGTAPAGTTLVTAAIVGQVGDYVHFDDVEIVLEGVAAQEPVIYGDLNDDFNVDISDLRIMAGRWLDNCVIDQWCDGVDLDRSGDVDMGDFAAFSESYPKLLPDILGVTHVGGKYYFSTEDFLNEGADRLLSLGTRVIKVWFHNVASSYPWNSNWPAMSTLKAQAESPYFVELFAKPFSTFILLAQTNASEFRDGMNSTEMAAERQQMYDLTTHLLNTYQDTGKTFILQHWEGDWLIRGHYDRNLDPTATEIQGMTDWLNTRQAGVDQARAEFSGTGVKVYHAAEVNVVVKPMGDGSPNVINAVVPNTNVDMVSYSSYDAISSSPEVLINALDFIALNTPDHPDFGDKNVYLGEYGFPENDINDAAVYQSRITNSTITALSWGCQYLVYWELYCNENKAGTTPPLTNNNDSRGFWLVKPDGTHSWSWGYFYGLLNPSP